MLKKKKKSKGNKFVKNYSDTNNKIISRKQSSFVDRKRKNKSNISLKKKLFLTIIIAIFLILFWLFFLSNIFTIKKLSISETSNIPQTKLEKIIWEQTQKKKLYFIPQNNIILLNKKDLSKKLNDNFQIETLKITKSLPNTLNIDIIEKEYSIIWNESNKFYHINRRGDIILTLDHPIENYTIIYNNGDSKILGRKIDIAPSRIDFISEFVKTADEKKIIKINEFIIDNTNRVIKFKEERGPVVIVSTEEDIRKQVTKLEALIQKELSGDFDRQHYIDLRYGNRIFYQ